MNKLEHIDFRVDPETKKNLESLAEQEGRSLSNLMVFISKKFVRENMKKIMSILVFAFVLLGCDIQENNSKQSLLAMQIQATAQTQQHYRIYGAYEYNPGTLTIFAIKNNYFPKFFNGYEARYLLLNFDVKIKEINLLINGQPSHSTISLMDYSQVIIFLYKIEDKFTVSGSVTDYDNNTISVNTGEIIYQ